MHRHLKKIPALTAGLLLAFNAHASNFWKHPDYDATVETWPCEERGICGRVHNLNPEDKGVREVVGKILKKPEKKVTREEVLSFCGYEGEMSLKQKSADTWEGKVFWPFREKFYGVSIRQEDQNRAVVRGYFLWFPLLGRTEKLIGVDNPPPPCRKPS